MEIVAFASPRQDLAAPLPADDNDSDDGNDDDDEELD